MRNLKTTGKVICLLSLLSATSSFGQSSNSAWGLNGNSAGNQDFIGTSNQTDLIFKTNNIERMRIKANGDLSISNPGLTKNLLVQDTDGGVIRLSISGMEKQVFNGTGAFSNIEDITGWTTAGTNAFTTFNGNYGIGTTSPTAKLDVNGTARISGQLQANEISTSHVQLNDISIRYTAATSTSPRILSFGGTSGTSVPNPFCYSSQINNVQQVNQFEGLILSHPPTNSASTVSLLTGYDGSNGIIEVTGDPAPGGGTPRLLLNYTCGKDVFVGNLFSGNLTANHRFYSRKSIVVGPESHTPQSRLEIMMFDDSKAFSVIDEYNNSKFAIHSNGKTVIGDNGSLNQTTAMVNVNQSSNTNYAMIIQNTGGEGKGLKIIAGSGTASSVDYPILDVASSSGTSYLRVNGKTGTTFARDILVTASNFPDYVFDPSYHVMSPNEIESFIIENKHLPGFPTAKYVEEHGMNVGEIQKKLVEKVEELTLIIIEQNKRIEALENIKK